MSAPILGVLWIEHGSVMEKAKLRTKAKLKTGVADSRSQIPDSRLPR